MLAEVLDKVREVRRAVDARSLPVDIEVDGGIDALPMVRVIRAHYLLASSSRVSSQQMLKWSDGRQKVMGHSIVSRDRL